MSHISSKPVSFVTPESRTWAEFTPGDLFRPVGYPIALYLRCDEGAIRLRDYEGNPQYQYKSEQLLNALGTCNLVTDTCVTLQSDE